MIKYILKRIWITLPTLLVISLLTYFISINAPGDPVEVMLNRAEGSGSLHVKGSPSDKEYNELRHLLGFDLPLFYFSLTDATESDTLYKISKAEHRKSLKRMSNRYGNWDHVSAYYLSIKQADEILEKAMIKSVSDSFPADAEKILSLKTGIYGLYAQTDEITTKDKIEKIVNEIQSNYLLNQSLQNTLSLKINVIRDGFNKVITEKNPYQKYIPAFNWYGFNNQYHNWITNFIIGDFGISYQDKRPVASIIKSALSKTLGISLTSILIAYLIAIPLGIHAAVNKDSIKEKTITTTLFILYSLPNFWIATMLVVFLCGGDYFSWFPAPGSAPIPDDAPFWYKFTESIYRLILPLFCWTYGSLAFISRQMRGGILSSISQDYIRTARAKGLTEEQIIKRHALKNSLLPIITLFASIFPLAISGAFVIENIFNISGMGKLSLDALYARDYPVIFTIMMFTAILTIMGNLISDILYSFIDPRITYNASN